MFDTLAKKKPSSLTELTKLVNRNYNDVLKDADILESMGIIKLEKKGSEIRPVTLYDRIVFDFGFQEPSLKDLKLEDKIVNNLLGNGQEISFLGSRDITSSQNSKKIKIPYKYHGKEDHYQKVRDLLRGNHPDSIDHYFVKNFGPGSMYNMEGRMKATDKNFQELLELIEKIEKFIKEDLEKGTEFEGEFEEKFPEVVKLEEER
ncbi:14698_t:CDS:2 [Cetraspora pellucida]|uniref:14698_t:CDS:1 n=1 Tax=Cetraspora pellucida TaxID=1433469 RepID=A0ACA9M2U0_9GLOM|nr:14698_t:CDS:2 [Cetraspora pellucida]